MVIRMNERTRWIFVVSGGVAVSLSWWGAPVVLLFVCFVPLLFVEEDIQSRRDPVFSLLPFSFFFFFTWNFIVCWWMVRIHPVGGMSVIILNAAFMTAVFLLYSLIKRNTGGGALIFVVLWTCFEFLHYRGDLSWPWLSLGNGLAADLRVIQWYEYTGTTGGTIWILLVNVMLFSVIKRTLRHKTGRAVYFLTALLVLLIVFPLTVSKRIFNLYEEKGKQADFLLLQPGMDPYALKYSEALNSEKLVGLLNLAENYNDIEGYYIVTPETSVDSIWINDPDDELLKIVYSFLEQHTASCLVLGATSFSSVPQNEATFTTRTDEKGDYFNISNSALFFCKEAPLQVYHKHYLANGVEQIPFQRIFRFMGKFSIDLGGVSGSLKRGEGAKVFRSPAGDSLVLGPLICFESAYGEYAARMVRKGAEILLVISNDGWFKSTGAYRQHLRLSQVRAVETRRSIVRVANTGISAHISQKGEIVDQIDWWEVGALSVNVARNDFITFFSRHGDYSGRIAFFFSILLMINLLVRIFSRSFKF